MKYTLRFLILLALLRCLPLSGQQTVNGGIVVLGPLRSNGSAASVDFTSANGTSPVRTGTLASRPVSCTVGQMYFATDAAAGQNLSYCTTPNVWTISSGNGGGAACKLASSLGFALNGTDETTLLNSTFSSFYSSGGGCLAIDSGKTLRADGQIVLPSGAANSYQNGLGGPAPFYRITGAGSNFSPASMAATSGNGSALDLRYHSSGISQYQGGPKLLAQGMGTLEIDHITVTTSAASDCATFLMTTAAIPIFHDFTVAGTGCNGGIVIGGVSSGIGGAYSANTPLSTGLTQLFQGYGGYIENVRLIGIGNATAPALTLNHYTNQFPVTNIWIGLGGSANAYLLNGGGTYSSSPGVAIDIEGHGLGIDGSRSNVIYGGIIELGGARNVPGVDYSCGVKLHNAEDNSIDAVGFYDGDSTTNAFCGDSTATRNRIGKSNYIDITGTQYVNSTWNDANYMPWRTIPFAFDGGGAALSGTTTRCARIPFGGTINRFSMLSDVAGSATVTVKVLAGMGSYTGVSSVTTDISNGGESLGGAAKVIDTSLTGWSYAGMNPGTGPLPANSVVCFTLSGASSISWLSGDLQLLEGR